MMPTLMARPCRHGGAFLRLFLALPDARAGARGFLVPFRMLGRSRFYDEFDACITHVMQLPHSTCASFPGKVIIMATDQPVDLVLVEAYLHNLQLALLNDQPQHAELLLAHALHLMAPAFTSRYPALLSTDVVI